MSYIQYTVECQKCNKRYNVAFGIVGKCLIAEPPPQCPETKCKGQLKKIADGWCAGTEIAES